MKMISLAVLAACTLLVLPGCVRTVDGKLKPGLPVGQDTIENRYEVPVEQVFEAAKKVLRFNGTLYGENTISKTLEAKIDTRTVRVAVDEVEPRVSRCRVQVRTKTGTGDIKLASQIATDIALHLQAR
jgi:hypothetical protein